MKGECKELMDKLYLLLDEELSEREILGLKAHLEDCPGCLDRFEVEKEFKALVRRRCGTQAVPGELIQKIRESLNREAR